MNRLRWLGVVTVVAGTLAGYAAVTAQQGAPKVPPPGSPGSTTILDSRYLPNPPRPAPVR